VSYVRQPAGFEKGKAGFRRGGGEGINRLRRRGGGWGKKKRRRIVGLRNGM